MTLLLAQYPASSRDEGVPLSAGERQACWQDQERLHHAPIGTGKAARKLGPTIARARVPCSRPIASARHPFVPFALMGAGSHLRVQLRRNLDGGAHHYQVADEWADSFQARGTNRWDAMIISF